MSPDLIVERHGAVGRLRLNRPRALHALTRAMCRAMSAALIDWHGDPSVKAVIIDHVAGRGFCAGGDVLMIAADPAGGEARGFFFDEYRLNHLLFTYSKPTVAVMDGVTMGGGVGIALPCRFKVATENTRLAMPETAIGLFPDVGAGWYLPRLPGRTGKFIGLTGTRLDGAECHYLGLATHYVPSDRRDELAERIVRAPARIKGTLGALSASPPEPRIAANLPMINRLFAGRRMEDIIAALAADPSDWAAAELATIDARSPLASKVALRLIAAGRRRRDFAQELAVEYAAATRIVARHDFREGVRALLVDKDNAPRWSPPSLAEVSDAMVDELLAPLPDDRAWTPFPSSGA